MIELFLPCGRVTTISDIDGERVRRHRWRSHTHNASGKPYVRAEIAGKVIYLHRFIVDGVVSLPATMKVDHEDTDTLNNQRPNLRVATHDQNNYNRKGFGISGFKGVSKDANRWRARITYLEVTRSLGRFATPEEAARAYDDAAVDLFGEFAWLNFPRPSPHPDKPPLEFPGF